MRLTRSLLSLMMAMTLATPLYAASTGTSGGFSRPSTTFSAPRTYSAPSVPRSGDFSKPPSSYFSNKPSTESQGFTKPPSTQAQPQTGSQSYGFTKPSTTPPPPSQAYGGFSKPGTQPQMGAATSVPRSQADQVIAKGQSKTALMQFDADQRKFQAPPVAPPPSAQAARQSPIWTQYGGQWRTADQYYAARRRAEQQLPPQVQTYYSNPPSYVASGPPAFGNLSSAFLGAAIGMIGTSAWDSWMYSHRNDPDYQSWHRYMQQKAEDDPDLKAKLDKLDARVKELEAEKAPVTNKLPDGVDPSLVVSSQTAMLATASSGFNWAWIYVPLLIIFAVVIFLAICVMVSRNRQRLA